jgi:molecular chaperone DnaK
VPQIEVEFALDANGILQVTATDKGTGKKADIRIENSGGLDKDEIEKMKADAEAHAEEDKKRRELVDLKNRQPTRRDLEEHGPPSQTRPRASRSTATKVTEPRSAARRSSPAAVVKLSTPRGKDEAQGQG